MATGYSFSSLVTRALDTYTRSEVDSRITVTSVNGKTGDVSINAVDVGARDNTWVPTAAQVGTYTTAQIDGFIAGVTGSVTSVAGRTGAITLSATDVTNTLDISSTGTTNIGGSLQFTLLGNLHVDNITTASDTNVAFLNVEYATPTTLFNMGGAGADLQFYVGNSYVSVGNFYGTHNLPTAAALSVVPNTRTINGLTLTSDITLTAGNLNAYTRTEADARINQLIAASPTGVSSLNGMSGAVTLDADDLNAYTKVEVNNIVSGLTASSVGAEPTLASDRKRKITVSTADPSGGNDGDVWFTY